VYWFPKAFDLFRFLVDALWCTSFKRLLIYLAFLLMLFGINQKPLETSNQRASTGKPNI
jgi:hypothetical protein